MCPGVEINPNPTLKAPSHTVLPCSAGWGTWGATQGTGREGTHRTRTRPTGLVSRRHTLNYTPQGEQDAENLRPSQNSPSSKETAGFGEVTTCLICRYLRARGPGASAGPSGRPYGGRRLLPALNPLGCTSTLAPGRPLLGPPVHPPPRGCRHRRRPERSRR